MSEDLRYLRLGAFVLVSGSLIAVALGALAWRTWFQPTFTFETYFDQSIAGLELGAQANFRGVPLGQVTEILTSAAAYERGVPIDRRHDYIVVRVKASVSAEEAEQMKEDIHTLIKRGLRAQTQLAGVTGQQYLELDFMEPEKYPPLPFEWKPKYTYLPSAPSVAGEIIAKAQSFLASLDEADIRKLARDLNTLIVHVDAKMREVPVARLSADLESVLSEARSVLARVDQALGAAPLDQTLAKVHSSANRLDALLGDPSLAQTLQNAGAISASLRELMESGQLDQLVSRLDEAATRLDVVLGDNQYDIRVTVQDLRATADNLRELSDTIKRDPAAVLFSGPPKKVQLPVSKR